MMVDFDDAKLKAIGWGGRRERTPLAAPGHVAGLTSTEQGEDWVTLKWRRPTDGGKVAAYKVLYRERDGDGEWKSADTAISTEITLKGQLRGKELEYCVMAINNAGEGVESNSVMVVL
ncbi:MAG: Fibronectin type III domain-containing protein [Candidatus Kentron sp. G]|nr:MAG: Fibronectin type III domain-containing protein [Candidatus Kentron sp. G]VFM96456.1 MAG: Fibronectin type III domain-containing protein [Candidatus Kentron sp. G]VFM98876.1 MAG: Fibronectin type III domain-containing protein [Candidatus Kentron sp. G]